jgi:hypothetical protein
MMFCAYRDIVYVFEIGAVNAEPIVGVIWVFVFISWFEFFAAYVGSVVQRAYGNFIYVSAVFEVGAVSATSYFSHLFTLKLMNRETNGICFI